MPLVVSAVMKIPETDHDGGLGFPVLESAGRFVVAGTGPQMTDTGNFPADPKSGFGEFFIPVAPGAGGGRKNHRQQRGHQKQRKNVLIHHTRTAFLCRGAVGPLKQTKMRNDFCIICSDRSTKSND